MGSIAGRLIDPDGKPVASTWIVLLPFGKSGPDRASWQRHITPDDGSYLFRDLPPGDYILVVNPDGPAAYEHPAYLPTWYPGAASGDGAARLTIHPSEALELPDFQLLPPLPEPDEPHRPR